MTQALTSGLLHFVWQGALVAFLLWAALGLLRNRSANARYLVSCSALAVMAVMPVITACVVYQRPVVATATEILSAVPVAAAAASLKIEPWLLPAWCAGVLLFSLRLLWGCGQVAAIRRRGEPAAAPILAMVTDVATRMRLRRPVRVLISSIAEGPSAIGWIRPAILLPAATVLGLTTDQLEAVIAHELAHIRRYDYLVNIVQMLVESVLFYHPAVWWTSARIRHERELCCDDAAVGCCGDALCYARALTTLERLRIHTPRLAVGSTGGSMMYRIERLVGVTKHQSAPSRWPGVLAMCLGLAVFAANTNWAQGQAQPKVVVDEPGVKTDLGKSTVTDRTPVEYPEAAIEKKVQGTVVVEATLDQTGAVTDARVVSGPTELRKAALQSVLEWHFTPESGGNKRRVSISFQTPPAESPVAAEYQGRLYAYQDAGDLQQLERDIQNTQDEVERTSKNIERQDPATPPKEARQFSAAAKSRAIEEQVLAAEVQKYELGASTPFIVLQRQKDLENAQQTEADAAEALRQASLRDRNLGGALAQAQIVEAQQAQRNVDEEALRRAMEAWEKQKQALPAIEAQFRDALKERLAAQQGVVQEREAMLARLKATQEALQAAETQRLAQGQQLQQEQAQPQITEWEIFQRLRESQQVALREQVSQGAQLTEQLKMMQAASAEAISAQRIQKRLIDIQKGLKALAEEGRAADLSLTCSPDAAGLTCAAKALEAMQRDLRARQNKMDLLNALMNGLQEQLQKAPQK